MARIIYLYVLDTMADWEYGYILAELCSGRFFRHPDKPYTLQLCGRTWDPVTTMGGVRLVPDLCIEEVKIGDGRVLILPGADTWLDSSQAPVLETLRRLLKTDILVGAICGATMGLAQAGLLDTRPHTSNDLSALQQFCPNYAGERYYVHKPAVTSGNLITATGLAPVDFACQVFKRLGVMRESTLEAWYQLYTTRRPEYFHQLMNSLRE